MTVPNLAFTELSGFHGAFATGVAGQQGALTLPDTWFRPPFWDLLMLQLLRPNSSNLPCLYSTFHLEYPLVLSRFYIVINKPDAIQVRPDSELPLSNIRLKKIQEFHICSWDSKCHYDNIKHSRSC